MKVVVVGGGIAGLTATRELLKCGHDVILLEAQEKVGGRIRTIKTSNGKRFYDLGASWFHDSEHNVLYHKAKEIGWPICFDEDHFKMYAPNENDSTSYTEITDFDKALRLCDNIPGEIGCDDAALYDISLKEFALSKLSPREALPIQSYEHFVGLCWDRISAVETPPNLLTHGKDAFQLGGNQLIIDWLFEECKTLSKQKEGGCLILHTNTPVEYIERRTSSLCIHTQNNEIFECSKAIITISLGCLREKHETMFPFSLAKPLRFAMANGVMAELAKIIVEFPFQFWSKKLSKAEVLGTPSGFITNAYQRLSDAGLPVLVIIIAPPTSTIIEKEPERAWSLVKPMLFALLEIPYDAIPDPANLWVSDWSVNPWIRGSYSALEVGQNMRDYVLPMMQGDWDGRLLFAGEHTTIHGAGCMDGAYASGIRAAKQACQSTPWS